MTNVVTIEVKDQGKIAVVPTAGSVELGIKSPCVSCTGMPKRLRPPSWLVAFVVCLAALMMLTGCDDRHYCPKCGKRFQHGEMLTLSLSGQGGGRVFHKECWDRMTEEEKDADPDAIK